MDEKIRINKFLSDAGVCSRREADRMILEGRITVNGEEAVSGQKVSGKDEICIDQIPVEKNEKKVQGASVFWWCGLERITCFHRNNKNYFAFLYNLSSKFN